MYAIRGTDSYYINADQIKDFLKYGWEIYDDNHKKLENPEQYATEKNIKTISLSGLGFSIPKPTESEAKGENAST